MLVYALFFLSLSLSHFKCLCSFFQFIHCCAIVCWGMPYFLQFRSSQHGFQQIFLFNLNALDNLCLFFFLLPSCVLHLIVRLNRICVVLCMRRAISKNIWEFLSKRKIKTHKTTATNNLKHRWTTVWTCCLCVASRMHCIASMLSNFCLCWRDREHIFSRIFILCFVFSPSHPSYARFNSFTLCFILSRSDAFVERAIVSNASYIHSHGHHWHCRLSCCLFVVASSSFNTQTHIHARVRYTVHLSVCVL